MSPSDRKPLQRGDLVHDFTRLGVPRGGLVMVHSSLRSIGYVKGGAETVVDALLEVLGPDGTLVVPTFTDIIARDPEFVFDLAESPSYFGSMVAAVMGAVPEAVRRRPGARRGVHLHDSVAATGPLSEAVTTLSGAPSWDAASPMGQVAQVMDLDGMYLLLGVPYQNLTAVHRCEFELGVPYRAERIVEGKMRLPDGSVAPLVSRIHPPKPGHPGSDYNRLGLRMERAGMVEIGEVGNAVARLFYGRHLRQMARALYEIDGEGFRRQNGVLTPLDNGHTVERPAGDLCVVDPARIYHSA